MATQFEYKLLELAGEFGSIALALDSLEIDRKLSEQKQDGWELASTGLSVKNLSSSHTHSYAIRVIYALKRAVASTNRITP